MRLQFVDQSQGQLLFFFLWGYENFQVNTHKREKSLFEYKFQKETAWANVKCYSCTANLRYTEKNNEKILWKLFF